jgi:hypothetical protein
MFRADCEPDNTSCIDAYRRRMNDEIGSFHTRGYPASCQLTSKASRKSNVASVGARCATEVVEGRHHAATEDRAEESILQAFISSSTQVLICGIQAG